MEHPISSSGPKYWCHQCRKEVEGERVGAEQEVVVVCPHCKSDFIEQIEEDEDPRNFVYAPTSNTSTTTSTTNTSTTSTANTSSNTNNMNRGVPPIPFGNMPMGMPGQFLNQMFMPTMFNMNVNPNLNPNSQPQPSPQPPATGQWTTFTFPNTQSFVFQSTDPNAPNPFANLHNTFNQFMQSFGMPMGGGPLNLNQLFGMTGNPGDYAFGRQFEDVLNQLFQNSQGRGAPPASDDALNKLPTGTITQEQVDNNLDCAICKDDFNVNEEVIKLPCSHCYHRDCIVKWLKMHNQCPICRGSLN